VSLGRPLALLVLAAATPASAVDAEYLLSARADLKGRSASPVALDLELLPTVEGALRWKDSRVSLAYAPSLLVRDLQGIFDAQSPASTAVLHRARFAVQKGFRHGSLMFSQDGAYGDLDVTGLRLPEGAAAGAFLESRSLGVTPYLRSATSLSVQAQPAKYVGFYLSGGFQVQGNPYGGDAEYALGQILGRNPLVKLRTDWLPFQYGPNATAQLRVRVSKAHTFVTTVTGSESQFVHVNQGPRRLLPVGRVEQQVLQLVESWEGRLSSTLSASFGLGVAVTHEFTSSWQAVILPGENLEVLPVAVAAFSTRLPFTGNRVLLNASLRLAPYADRFTGLVYERIEGRALAEWRPTRTLLASASATVAWGVGLGATPQGGDRLVSGEVSSEWAWSPWVSLGGLVRALYSAQQVLQTTDVVAPTLYTADQFQWTVTLSVIFRHRDSVAW
jgi:hypothetical protein